MTDRTLLDGLVSAASQPLQRQLLEAFRDVARDPGTAQVDYATRLKAVMEEALAQEAADAPAQPHDQ
jgi:hypothetical protein